MEQMPVPEKRRVYYGWVVVGLAMLSMSFWFGLRTSFSLFFGALIDQFHWSRAEAAGVQSLAMFVYMITAPIVGTLVDRIGPRRVILPGTILLGLGLLLCTQIQTLGQFYLFFGVIVGIGITCLSIAPFAVILAHWFVRYRGKAYGLASVGIGGGTLIFIPLIQYLISFHSWQIAFLIFGLLVLIIPLPLNGFFLKHKPQEVGSLPDGDRIPPHPDSDPRQSKMRVISPDPPPRKAQTIRELLRTVRFWALLLFPACTGCSVYILIVHSVKSMVDLGVDTLWAASLFAATGAVSSVFRFFWGWLSDRIGREITFTLGGTCFSSGILFLLLYATFPSSILLYLFALLFGAGWGVTSPMFMAIAADLYHGEKFGTIYGLVEGVIGIGAAFGSWVAGFIFDQTRSYFWAFLLAILLNLISVGFAWVAAPRKVRPIVKSSEG